MAETIVVDRYATSLMAASRLKKTANAVGQDIDSLQAMLKASPALRTAITSPLVASAEQEEALVAIATKAKLSDTVVNLIRLLAKNRRLDALPAILDAAKDMIEAEGGNMKAHVTAAVPLDDKTVASITDKLKKTTGKDVTVNVTVDPEILGGLIIRYGSTLIDDSVKTRLDRLKRTLGAQAA